VSAGSGQRGFALVELVVAMTIMLIVTGAVLTAFNSFSSTSERNSRLTHAEDRARTTMQAMARSMRNATAFVRADYDLRFQTDRPDFGIAQSTSGYKVRYCLEDSTRRLWLQAGPASGSDAGAACPDAGWGTQNRVIASDVVNRYGGRDRPLFPAPSGTRSIPVDLWVNVDPAHGAPEVHLESAVFVRSLSQTAPTLSPDDLEEDCEAEGGPLLTATTTTDGAGLPLSYTFSENGSVIGTGHSVRLTPGSHELTITVTNVLGLQQVITKSVC
jgi:prepilin-type N-terminal cleavage/methylation domain-containing protein